MSTIPKTKGGSRNGAGPKYKRFTIDKRYDNVTIDGVPASVLHLDGSMIVLCDQNAKVITMRLSRDLSSIPVVDIPTVTE